MIKKLRTLKIPLRLQFLVIAASLAITSTLLGLSAYLTDTDTYQSTFRTIAGDDMGFSLTGEAFEDTAILPGQEIELNVTASVTTSNDLFVFVEIDLPDVFIQPDINTQVWHPLEEGSNVYFFGYESSLLPLGPSSGTTSVKVFDKIMLSTEVDGSNSYTITVTGYAIQSTNIPSTATPMQVFDMIGGDNN